MPNGEPNLKLFLSPHNDDEALFGTFTILRERPLVAIVTDSYVQENRGTGITAAQRRDETANAMQILRAPLEFLGLRDDADLMGLWDHLRTYGQPEMVFAPAPEMLGHPQHNEVGSVAQLVFNNVTHYLTYTTSGKSRSTSPVSMEPDWPLLKLRALACYESQIRLDNTRDHFLRDQWEYYL